jgi:hypothetical protein
MLAAVATLAALTSGAFAAEVAGTFSGACIVMVASSDRDPAAAVSPQARLAAKEVRRYLWHTAGQLAELVTADSPDDVPPRCRSVVLVAEASLASVAWLRSSGGGGGLLSGGGAAGAAAAARVEALEHPGEHLILPLGRRTALVAGHDGAGVVYAAYRFAEAALGVHFSIAGDVLPHRSKVKFTALTQNLQFDPVV